MLLDVNRMFGMFVTFVVIEYLELYFYKRLEIDNQK